MSPVTTHILDIARGRPASGVLVALARRRSEGAWEALGQGRTDDDGRLRDLLPAAAALEPGHYRLVFAVAAYFERLEDDAFYPEVSIVFEVKDGTQHYHVPLLLSPFGYSTYRGS